MITAFLLAGGRGTRLLPYTTVLPKPLMPVGEVPVMELLLRQLARDGIRDVIVSVGHLAELIEAYFGDGARFGLRLRYQHEIEPMGTAGPLRYVECWGDSGALLVLNGDLLTDLSFADFSAHYTGSGAIAQVGTVRRTEHVQLGVLDLDDDGLVRGYSEKPIRTYDVSMGVYIISRAVRDLIPSEGPFDMPQLILAALARGLRVTSYRHEGVWLDIGRPEDHRLAVEMMAEDPARLRPPMVSMLL